MRVVREVLQWPERAVRPLAAGQPPRELERVSSLSRRRPLVRRRAAKHQGSPTAVHVALSAGLRVGVPLLRLRSRGILRKPQKSSHGEARIRLARQCVSAPPTLFRFATAAPAFSSCCERFGSIGRVQSKGVVRAQLCRGKLMLMASKEPRSHEPPNPSIEGTSYGLRPPAAPHVKR